jgi:hypothetical protein
VSMRARCAIQALLMSLQSLDADAFVTALEVSAHIVSIYTRL